MISTSGGKAEKEYNKLNFLKYYLQSHYQVAFYIICVSQDAHTPYKFI